MINPEHYSTYKLCAKINSKIGLFVKTLQKYQLPSFLSLWINQNQIK